MISFNNAQPDDEITVVIGKPDITVTVTDNTGDS